MYKFGCIGIGNMGGAVAQALVQAAGGGSLMVSSRTREKAEAAAARLGCMAGDNRDLAAQCQYLFLGVKPQILPGVLEELAPVLRSRKSPCVLVSMAAGVSLARLQSLQALYAAWPDAEHIARKEDCTVNGNVLDYTVTYTVAADICG